MAFIDLTESAPTQEGKYEVEIHSLNGLPKHKWALWYMENGFELLDYELAPEEFIKGWRLE